MTRSFSALVLTAALAFSEATPGEFLSPVPALSTCDQLMRGVENSPGALGRFLQTGFEKLTPMNMWPLMRKPFQAPCARQIKLTRHLSNMDDEEFWGLGYERLGVEHCGLEAAAELNGQAFLQHIASTLYTDNDLPAIHALLSLGDDRVDMRTRCEEIQNDHRVVTIDRKVYPHEHTVEKPLSEVLGDLVANFLDGEIFDEYDDDDELISFLY